MFTSMGRGIARHRRLIARISVVMMAAAILVLALTSTDTSSQGSAAQGATSNHATGALVCELAGTGNPLFFLIALAYPS